MMYTFPSGVWPVMLTPFAASGEVDHEGLAALTEWYIGHGVQGLFAACQSSEIFYLSAQERQAIVRTVVQAAHGRVPVIASGHVAEDLYQQVEEIYAIADAGAEAVVLISNRLAPQDAPEAQWLDTLEWLLSRLDLTLRLGMYECPHPYKQLMSEAMLRACAQSGRFHFMKDTCCDAPTIRKRLQVLEGTPMRLYNANTATLLDSLRHGAAGFSGVMANFHPQLYVWLCENPQHPEAPLLQDLLTITSLVERQCYPVCAKYHLQAVEHLPLKLHSRTRDAADLTVSDRALVESVARLTQEAECRLGQPILCGEGNL